MSKIQVVSVRDSAVGAFGRPVFVPSVGAAVRSFSDEVNRKGDGNQMNEHPEDFEMWHLAVFDEESGVFALPDDGVRVLSRGKDVLRAAE